MCCTRSYYSWDIVIEKVDGKLFFDKRDNTEFGTCDFQTIKYETLKRFSPYIDFRLFVDLLTVNETAIEPPQEDPTGLNSPKNLSLEATFINHNFSQQVLKSVIRTVIFSEFGSLEMLTRDFRRESRRLSSNKKIRSHRKKTWPR